MLICYNAEIRYISRIFASFASIATIEFVTKNSISTKKDYFQTFSSGTYKSLMSGWSWKKQLRNKKKPATLYLTSWNAHYYMYHTSLSAFWSLPRMGVWRKNNISLHSFGLCREKKRNLLQLLWPFVRSMLTGGNTWGHAQNDDIELKNGFWPAVAMRRPLKIRKGISEYR